MSTDRETKLRRLAVLLISKNNEKDSPGLVTIGNSEPTFAHQEEMDNYCELLSASNILFDIIGENDISENTFVSGDLIKYVTVIVTVPFSVFSNGAFRLINEASRKYGISFIASFNHVDERSKDMFGIVSLRGKKPLWPLRIKIICWPRAASQEKIIANYSLLSGFPGIRSRGLRKMSWKQTWKKAVRMFRSMIVPYFKVELGPKASVLATDIKGKPLAWSCEFGRATNYYFAMHGGLFLDKFNEMHRLVRAIIETNSGFGMASVKLENSMALRLDDPGACCADYLDNGGILEKKDWQELGNILESRGIPLSVVYVPGWVDDGDIQSGKLFIDGEELIERKAGTLYDSARVRYLPAGGKYGPYDHTSEYDGLRTLVKKGIAEVHSHGLTHLDPDHKSWANAKDRNRDTRWHREFYHAKHGKPVERDEQSNALSASRNKIFNLFGSLPLAFAPSGHKHGHDSDLLCFDAGYLLFSADYTGFLKKNILIRNWKIRSLFLYLKDPSPFAGRSGYPFIGVVHDYEIKNGLDKFEDIIEKWRSTGVKRFLSINDLVISLCSTIDAYYDIGAGSLNLNLYLPTRPSDNGSFSELSGREICLRIILPNKMIPHESNMTVSGGTLLLFNKEDANANITISIRSNDSSVIRIQLPLSKSQ